MTEEEQLVRDTTREFVDQECRPLLQDAWREGTFPVQLIPRMGSLGLLGASFPEGEGGSGVSAVAYGLIMEELERGDSGLRSFASVQGGLVMYPIWRYGSTAQKQTWLPLLGRGEKVGCFGLTEPGYGSNPGGMVTRAHRDGDDWVLNGSKMWITNGSIADVAVVWAKDDDDTIRGFLVETDRPGFTAPEISGKMSLRASVTSELVLQGVRVPESNRLPGARGLAAPLSCLTQARYGIAWGAVGAAIDCYETALEYALERKQFSRKIAGYQLTQTKLADMLTEITKAQLLCLHLGWLKEKGKMDYTQVSMAKRNNVQMARDVARTAREILGANGIIDDFSLMRHMANLESVVTYEGTHEMHGLILGEKITGLKAFD
ncbi:MAG: acyl-CoA dehydrogenase [Candidatus Neomarinimicrobiota bacterium]|nr:MAG: acyl-CoA dehydrogenase [Candidatus Neomarinimicrobiota bacterium]